MLHKPNKEYFWVFCNVDLKNTSPPKNKLNKKTMRNYPSMVVHLYAQVYLYDDTTNLVLVNVLIYLHM